MADGKKRIHHTHAVRVGGLQILIVTIVAVAATGVMILLDSDILRSNAAGRFVDVPTGITADGDPYMGVDGAPLQMVVYSDFLCGHCRGWAQVLSEVAPEWVGTGQLQITFKNFAFLTPESVLAAEAGECALDQGSDAFWRLYDKLFDAQDQGLAGYTPSAIKGYAEEIGLDAIAFGQCLDSGTKAGAIEADLDAGVNAGVQGTPSWFLNGNMVAGMHPAEELETLLTDASNQ